MNKALGITLLLFAVNVVCASDSIVVGSWSCEETVSKNDQFSVLGKSDIEMNSSGSYEALFTYHFNFFKKGIIDTTVVVTGNWSKEGNVITETVDSSSVRALNTTLSVPKGKLEEMVLGMHPLGDNLSFRLEKQSEDNYQFTDLSDGEKFFCIKK